MHDTKIDDLLWAAGLALQFGLLAVVLVRGLARRMPAFTLLLAFYPLRSAALFGLYGHLAPANYAATANALSLVDLLLQLLLAMEIAAALVRTAGGWTLRRVAAVATLPALAWAATWLLCGMLPANAPVPPDRLQVFNWLVLSLLALWAMPSAAGEVLRSVAVGFGFYGGIGLVATAVRTTAAMHRDAAAFSISSYVLSATWVLLLFLWMGLPREDEPGAIHLVRPPAPTSPAYRTSI
jgi:hypothetical protein